MSGRGDVVSTKREHEAGVEGATGAASRRRVRGAEFLLLVAVVAGLAAAAGLTHQLDARRPPADSRAAGEELYVTPDSARRMSLGFNGLVADWYWMRALQYVGRRAIAHTGELQLDDLSPLALHQLAPLLNQTTTLDPQFMAAYEYGAVVLPAVDVNEAIKFVEKGIRENPREWRLRHHLGYILWQQKRFNDAARVYGEGAELPNAPAWMRVMSAQMAVGGGSRETAREIYRRMLESDDESVQGLARLRLLQLDSMEEREAINQLLNAFRVRLGRCPREWREAAPLLRMSRGITLDASGAPLDPTGVPYILSVEKCEALLSGYSKIPQK